MGFLILIVVVVILMFCLAGWLGFALFVAENRSQKKAEENAPAILDQAFVGEDVVFKINMQSPKYETVVLGAKTRGYALTNETNDAADGIAKTLIFQKVLI
jgi:flagellar basal body-associated protein FliL